MSEPLDLELVRSGARLVLRSPAVGLFTEARATGTLLSPGEPAGALLVLGRVQRLRVPAGVEGRIVSALPERVQSPVAYGEVLYELEPLAQTKSTVPGSTTKSSSLVLRSAQSGRFYQRPAPGESPFVSSGQVVADGQPLGLIEVMKTFTHVVYRASATLPPRAKVLRFVAGDGGEVRAGDVLLEFERA